MYARDKNLWKMSERNVAETDRWYQNTGQTQPLEQSSRQLRKCVEAAVFTLSDDWRNH